MSIAGSIPVSLPALANSTPSVAGERPTAAETPLPPRRFDLIVKEQFYQGQRLFIVKDPLTLRYFRFAPAEFRVFQLLDGKLTINSLQKLLSRELSQVTTAELLQLVQRWQSAGLLQETGAMATARILASQSRTRSNRWQAWVSSILYLKVHAFDPDWLLTCIYPWVGWLFRPIGVFLAFSVIFSAVVLVTSRFEEFTSQPEMQNLHAFFNLQNIAWLWLTVGIVKILHEMGHGLACKHFGGECHAMGMLLMCFTPCMYCDVSDSWMLPNKWHRIAIAAAGIYIELLIAAVATFVWWSTAPGVLHGIAFSAMVFGSVQTFLINANPLMRFDGYYAMSDYLEIPNLRQKSYAFTKYYLTKWFWGTTQAPPGHGGFGFVVYAVLASIYRVMLTIAMIWLFSRILEPYKLAFVGWGLSAMALTSMVVVPVGRGITTAIRNPSAARPHSLWRPLMAMLLIGGAVAAFFFVPIPHRAYAVLTMEPAQSAAVSTATRGQIVKQYVTAGQRVSRGDPILELDNPALRMQSERMEQQLDKLRVQSRIAVAVLDPARAQAAQVALKELESQWDVLQGRIKDLVLRAPEDGHVIFEPQKQPVVSSTSSFVGQLGQWQRTALHPENVGALLDTGTEVCRIATTDECVAIAVLSQSQIEAVSVGQDAAVKLDAFPVETFLGTVEEISLQDAEQVALQLTNLHGSELPTISSGPRAGQLAEAHYRVRIELTSLTRGELAKWPAHLKTGLRGKVWIRCGSQTASQMAWRWICQVIQW